MQTQSVADATQARTAQARVTRTRTAQAQVTQTRTAQARTAVRSATANDEDYVDDDDDDKCPVCLKPLPDEPSPDLFHCVNGHKFHRDCIKKWFQASNGKACTCPACRHDLFLSTLCLEANADVKINHGIDHYTNHIARTCVVCNEDGCDAMMECCPHRAHRTCIERMAPCVEVTDGDVARAYEGFCPTCYKRYGRELSVDDVLRKGVFFLDVYSQSGRIRVTSTPFTKVGNKALKHDQCAMFLVHNRGGVDARMGLDPSVKYRTVFVQGGNMPQRLWAVATTLSEPSSFITLSGQQGGAWPPAWLRSILPGGRAITPSPSPSAAAATSSRPNSRPVARTTTPRDTRATPTVEEAATNSRPNSRPVARTTTRDTRAPTVEEQERRELGLSVVDLAYRAAALARLPATATATRTAAATGGGRRARARPQVVTARPAQRRPASRRRATAKA